VGNIFISIICHLLQWCSKLVAEHTCVDVLSLGVDDLGHAELDIWNVIFSRLYEDRNNLRGYLILHDVRHHSGQRVQTAHTIVVSLLVNDPLVEHDGKVLLNHPLLLEVLSQN